MDNNRKSRRGSEVERGRQLESKKDVKEKKIRWINSVGFNFRANVYLNQMVNLFIYPRTTEVPHPTQLNCEVIQQPKAHN